MRITNLIAGLSVGLALILLGANVSALCAEASESQPTFAKICLDRDVALIMLIDDHAMVEDIASDTLSGAFSDLLDARALCYHGKTADGVSAYETIARRLGPLRIGRKQ